MVVLRGVRSESNCNTAAASFNEDIVPSWDALCVTSAFYMFCAASAFNGNIGAWDTSGVKTMISMWPCDSAFNQDISGWAVQSVTDMRYMFTYVSAFDQDLGWCVDDGVSLDSVFVACVTVCDAWPSTRTSLGMGDSQRSHGKCRYMAPASMLYPSPAGIWTQPACSLRPRRCGRRRRRGSGLAASRPHYEKFDAQDRHGIFATHVGTAPWSVLQVCSPPEDRSAPDPALMQRRRPPPAHRDSDRVSRDPPLRLGKPSRSPPAT